jgi:toxin-antitoxin system PIN domain toxin
MRFSVSYLLDVNLLIALSWPEHGQHAPARSWFAKHSRQGWATCPLVQAGFVRIVSNPGFSRRAVSSQEAIEALRISLKDQAHQFWPDSIAFADAMLALEQPIQGHQQVTHAYLVALAIHNRGKLATLDRKIAQVARAGAVEVIG